VEKVLETLLLRTRIVAEDKALLRAAREDLRELAGTVDGLLRWSVGATTVRRRPVDLSRLLRDVATSSSEPARVEVLTPGAVTASVDRPLIRGAIANLVRNALVYAGPTASVELSLIRDHGSATVVVRDDGPGIAAEERDSVFDPFVRGRHVSRASSGSGLGLFLARRVVEAHGGSIWLESAERGAAFCIRLPEVVG
jgi:signal transduction histidine kinase